VRKVKKIDFVEIVRNNITSWNRHDAKAAFAKIAGGATLRNPFGDFTAEVAIERQKAMWQAFPDASMEIVKIGHIGEGLIAGELVIRGTNTGPLPDGTPATGSAFTIRAATFVQFERDKVKSEHIYYDLKNLFEQLGTGRRYGLNGQWMGRYTGTNSGLLVIDLDDMGTYYEGRALAFDNNTSLPAATALIRTPDKSAACDLRLDLFPINPRTGDPSTWDQVAPLFPSNVVFPRSAEARLSLDKDTLLVNWKTDIETASSATLPRSRAGEPTEYRPLTEITNWSEFKTYVTAMEPRRYIFRGQKELLRLRTGFHRTGRADLMRFLGNDIQTLHRHLSQRTTHIFNLSIGEQNGAFFNLAQHHGYPTPLLDWTYSPFVGAFFAYRRVKDSEAARANDNEKVRIFIFDQKLWRSSFPQIVKLAPFSPHFSIMEFIAIDNERLIPQQSISSVTNIDDIETYIRSKESAEGQYLRIVDLPVKERSLVMQELSMMGITAGSLFPGFDGACEELRERHFRS
jgi:FRG domain/SnoaL-like polyketide cyclase